jgi:tetratricopeptide (TPR) repeat protein
MELSLKYNEHATNTLSGAFIRGNSPDGWLQEMNAWRIPLEQLLCFIISQNNNPVEAAGLFVIFRKEQLPGILQVRHPYTVLGGKLFIPIDGELSPAVSEAGLQSLLIWDYQVFHPTIGFIGFEKSDRIELADLLQYTEAETINWGYAHAGQLPWIPLHQINVQQLAAEEVFDAIKESINSKPLTEIPKSNKKDVPSWLNNPVAEGLLKGTYKLLSGLSSLVPSGLFGSDSNFNSRNYGDDDKSGPGLFSRIMNWMSEKIEDLEKQRDSELKRLSDLFEKNSDEALQYAIPLNSPYLNRGTAASPSARLAWRPTQFNLNRLGGGRAVDGWNMGNYYSELRTKYLKAAQDAIEKKDFKKAAYVYAHLLGDYSMAASTLRQGKHFREAAVLYKDHLKNLPLAAACLEEGGLYTEAIELYTGLNQHEKAGDLYMMLSQEEPALQCYEKCVDLAVLNKDYLEESRIITDKIGDRQRARKVLLNGWQDVKQSEACLMKYFDLVADEKNEPLHTWLRSVYSGNVPADKEMSFLNVIDKVNQKYRTPALENTCKEIAYEVVSEQVNAGNAASLHSLRNFVPGDQLLTPDCYRFIHTFKDVPAQKATASQLQLVKDVVWKQVVTWQNQVLVWGIRSSGLVLARLTWDGHVEYFSWHVSPDPNTFLITLVDQEHAGPVILYANNGSLDEKMLPMNKYFRDAVRVFQPDFIPPNVVAIGMHKKGIFTLHAEQGEVFLNQYSLNGKLIESCRCIYKESPFNFAFNGVREITYCDGYLYMASESFVLKISETGEVDVLYHTDGVIVKIAVSKRHDGLVNIAFAYGDCITLYTRDANDNVADPFVVNEIIPVDLSFMSGDRFVVGDKQKVQVYDFTDYFKEYAMPDIYWEVETDNDVVAVFQGSNRDQLGILEANGQITWHTITEPA